MDKVIGLDQVRAELVIVRTPDGSGKLELTKFHTPSDEKGAYPSPANQLGIRISPSSSMTWTRSSTDCAPTALA